MEWDSKSNPWNTMNKLELQDNMFESNMTSNNMFSIDLKLGMLEHIGDVPIDTLKNSRGLTTMASSSSTSPSSALSKRGRPRSVGVHSTVYCSVDGCISDLSHGREYHRRHRVCERHSKTPLVLIGGREQRFCQQCSRFHSLGEFDDAKRSCRKRLDGHNRRRRKSQTETIYMTSSAGFPISHTGSELLQFCCTPDNWPVISEPEKGMYSDYNQRSVTHQMSSLWSTSCEKGDTSNKQLPYASGINQHTLFQSSPSVISSTETRTSSLDGSSECALSLLSMCPTQSSMMFSSPTIPQLAMNSEYNLARFSSSKGLEDESSASLSSTSTTNNSHFFEAFHSGQDHGFNGSRPSRVFPFSWQ